MTDIPALGEFGHAGDDVVVPFHVDGLEVRGRAVQMGQAIDAILSRHDYPEPVARLLAEAVVLTALIGSSLKFDGKLTLQAQTNGAVSLLVVDYMTPDAVRAYARFDADADWTSGGFGRLSSAELLGTGLLAMTIDQGAHTQRYQGVVHLDGAGLEAAAKTYFRQSEQIPTDVRIAVARLVIAGDKNNSWRAGGILMQFLPDAGERMKLPDLPGGDGDDSEGTNQDEAWQEATMLLATVEADELTDPHVGTERLLFRLFHDRGVRVHEGIEVRDKCSCSRERIGEVLMSLPREELDESAGKDGKIEVNCEFCSTTYILDRNEF